MSGIRRIAALAAVLVSCSRRQPPPPVDLDPEDRAARLAAVVARHGEAVEARAGAAMDLARLEPIRGRCLGTILLVDALRDLPADERASVAAALAPKLAAALAGATADTGYPLADLGFLLLTDEFGPPLLVEAAAATRLKDELTNWLFGDLDGRWAYTNNLYAPERLFHAVGASAAAKLVATFATGPAAQIDRKAAIVARDGDEAARAAAAAKLVEIAEAIGTDAWLVKHKGEIERDDASPAPPAEKLRAFQDASLRGVLAAMKRFGGGAVARYGLQAAANPALSEESRAAALAAAKGQLAGVDDAPQKLVALLSNEVPLAVGDVAAELLRPFARERLAPLIFEALPKLDWQRRRLALVALLRVSKLEHVGEILDKLPDAADFHLLEAEAYGACIGEMSGPVEALLDRRIDAGYAEARLTALGYYASWGSKRQIAAIARHDRDPQEVPPCDGADCGCSAKKNRRIKTVGDFVRLCVIPRMAKRDEKPDRGAAP